MPGLPPATLAARVGVSARAVQLGFRRVTGVPPSTFVRNTRLDRVHASLLEGTGEPITDLAFHYGFGHLGRFAQQYRDRFGVLPSQTQRGNSSAGGHPASHRGE
ncbi:helix-turn-helix domain-containing protein [Pseudonocardia xishanensis]|uniref:helix-turn-helix domain-containing protein n=1 Tax=Pseudonocardia xishanensis TaxID=630995 RepID=UPI003CD05C50